MTEINSEKVEKNVDPSTLAVPKELPVLPLNDFVFFPGMGFPLQVANPASRKLVDDALLHNRMLAVVSRKKVAAGKGKAEARPGADLYSVGVAAYIHKLVKAQEGFYQVLLSAVKKIRRRRFSNVSRKLI